MKILEKISRQNRIKIHTKTYHLKKNSGGRDLQISKSEKKSCTPLPKSWLRPCTCMLKMTTFEPKISYLFATTSRTCFQ